MYILSFVLELHQKSKSILRKNCCFFLNFYVVFPVTIENYWEF